MPWAQGALQGTEAGRPAFSGSDYVELDPAAVDLDAHPGMRDVRMRDTVQVWPLQDIRLWIQGLRTHQHYFWH